MTGPDVLKVKLQANDSGADTVEGYLIALLSAVWDEQEGFSGKRPFGNSGWEYDLYKGLIAAGAVDGKLDGDGFLEEIDAANRKKADQLIKAAIQSMGELTRAALR